MGSFPASHRHTPCLLVIALILYPFCPHPLPNPAPLHFIPTPPCAEIHNIVGAGKSDGAMDASNLLKPMLARGELRCIGATTLDEYRQYIEKDPALERYA